MGKLLQAYGIKNQIYQTNATVPSNNSAAIRKVEELIQIANGTHTDFSSTQKALFRWGTANRCIIEFNKINELPLLCNRTAEHEVFYHCEYDKAIKVVKPGEFGLGINWTNEDVSLGKGTLKFYVERQMFFNLAFGGTYAFEGVTIIKDEILEIDIVTLVVSQNWVWAKDIFNPNPSSSQISQYMKALNFKPGQRTNQWFRVEDNIYVADTREDNFVLTDFGVVPIDIIVAKK